MEVAAQGWKRDHYGAQRREPCWWRLIARCAKLDPEQADRNLVVPRGGYMGWIFLSQKGAESALTAVVI